MRTFTSASYAIISLGNGLLPVRRQAIFWTNDGQLIIRPLAIDFS